MNIVDEIFNRAKPDAPALISSGGSVSFGELDEATRQVSRSIREKRFAPASRIALDCPDGRDYITLALAILRAGHCLVPVAKELAPAERRELFLATAVDALITHRPEPAQDLPDITWSEDLPERDLAPRRLEELRALEPAFIRFTSGTTGARKGVVLSHKTLRERITAANAGLKIGSADRVLWLLPMSHHFAVSLVLYLYDVEAKLLPDSHLAEDVLDCVITQNATVFYASPFHYQQLAEARSERGWPSLRLAVSSAAALAPETGVKFRELYGVPVRQALGIIEVGLPVLNTSDPFARPESVGTPQPGFEIDLRDPNGRSIPAGQTGELFVRGPGLFDAYLEPWQPREQVLENGWFHTGDLATVDGDGFLFLQGRTHSVLNVGGMKVFPEEVEQVLNQLPEIAESRVIARSHNHFGQVPAAEVVAAPGCDIPGRSTLLNHCRNHLSAYKVPVEFRVVQDIPRTPSGKISRSERL